MRNDFEDLDVPEVAWAVLQAGLLQDLQLVASLVIAGSYEKAWLRAAPGFDSVFLHDVSH